MVIRGNASPPPVSSSSVRTVGLGYTHRREVHYVETKRVFVRSRGRLSGSCKYQNNDMSKAYITRLPGRWPPRWACRLSLKFGDPQHWPFTIYCTFISHLMKKALTKFIIVQDTTTCISRLVWHVQHFTV